MSTKSLTLAGGCINSIASDSRMLSSDMPFGSLCGQTTRSGCTCCSPVARERETSSTRLVNKEDASPTCDPLSGESSLNVKTNEIVRKNASEVLNVPLRRHAKVHFPQNGVKEEHKEKLQEAIDDSLQNTGEGEDVEAVIGEHFTAQYLVECLSSLFEDLAHIPKLKVDASFAKQLERIVALLTSLIDARSWKGVVGALTLYFDCYVDGSITGTCLDYVGKLFKFSPQAGEKDTEDLPAFIKLIRLARDNFSVLKGNALFGHFSKFLGLVVAVGMCNTADVTFNIGKFKLFEPCLKTAHGDAENILEALFYSVTFFIERIYFCFKNKNIAPLLISDEEAADIDEELAQVTLFWALHRNGNLFDVKGIHEYEFERRLNNLGVKLKNLLACKTGIEKSIVKDKYVKILQMISDLTLLNTSGELREAPFSIELFGNSGVGKSTAYKQLCNVLLASAGHNLDEKYRCAINADDPYMSNWTSDKTVMLLDDFANARADKTTEPPTKYIILAKNNAPAYAPKAEIEGKGKCAIKPKILFITTNTKDLAAAKYSVNPFSIQNRADFVLSIENRPECLKSFEGSTTIDRNKCDEWHQNNGLDNSMIEDIWLITIEKPVRPEDESFLAKYKVVKNDDGKLMEKVSMQEAARFLIKRYAEFREDQKKILQKSKELKEVDYTLCGINGCQCPKLLCDVHKGMHPQSGELGERLSNTIDNIAEGAASAVTKQFTWLAFNAESVTTVALIASSRLFAQYFDWMMLLPEDWVRSPVFLSFAMLFNKEQIARNYIKQSLFNWFPVLCLILTGKLHPIMYAFACVYAFYAFFRQLGMGVIVKDKYREEICARNDCIHSSVKTYRDEISKYAAKGVLALGIIWAASRFLAKMSRNYYKPQGNLDPQTQEDIKARDKEENCWAQQTIRKLPMSSVAKSSTPSETEGNVVKNLFYAEIKAKGKTLVANTTYLTTNVLMLPVHYFIDDHLEVEFYKDKAQKCGGRHSYKISQDASVRIGNSDMAICYVAAGGSMTNLLPYLPTEDLSTDRKSVV